MYSLQYELDRCEREMEICRTQHPEHVPVWLSLLGFADWYVEKQLILMEIEQN